MLFVAMNFSSSFNAEIQKTENGELAAQQVLLSARRCSRVCERAFPSTITTFVSHAAVANVRAKLEELNKISSVFQSWRHVCWLT